MKTIDLRSDTVTNPTQEMREAMATAIVGDDVYGDDPTVNELEQLAADVLGKEAGLFVTSGTQGNLLGIWSQTNRGEEIILGTNSHVMIHEVGGVASICQCMTKTISNEFDFIFPNNIIESIRPNVIQAPKTTLLCLENALGNGIIMPLDLMKENYRTAKSFNLNVHLDGARIFNVASALNVDVKDIAKNSDTVMFCLSKGLCAPVGSMLVGPKETINKARKLRQIIGGGLRQSGILAAAGIIGINKMSKRLNEDHINAKYLANHLDELPSFNVLYKQLDINMVFAYHLGDSEALYKHLVKNNIKINPADEQGLFRFVCHNDISRADIDEFVNIIKQLN